MIIKDLQVGQGKVEVTAKIISVEEPKEFERFGKKGRVAKALIKDESGEIKLTLWNEEIEKVKPGMAIKIINGYVSEWKGEKQLTTGKFGQLEMVGREEEEKEVEKETKEEESGGTEREEEREEEQLREIEEEIVD